MACTSSWTSLYKQHFDPEKIHLNFFTENSEFAFDSILQPLNQVERVFTSGDLKGDLLIIFGISTNIHFLFPASAHFKEIIIVHFLDIDQQYVEKWMKKDSKAFCWKPSIEFLYKNEKEREQWAGKEEKSKELITQVVKAEVTDYGMEAPKSLPQADCVLFSYVLNFLCPDKNAFITSMRNMSSLLKVGGHVLMHVFMNATFIMQGDFKFPLLCVDKEHVLKVLNELGFAVKETEMNKRVNSTKLSNIDFSAILFVDACKERDV